MTTTTQEGVDSAILATEDDAANEFLNRWSDEDPEKVSEAPEEEEVETDDESESTEDEADDEEESSDETETDPEETGDDEAEDDTDDEEESAEEEPKGSLKDDAKVKVKVGDEEHEVSVKDLKRLFGQEASLTKKSQKVADDQKRLDAANEKAAAQLERIYDKVKTRWEPYSKVDMLLASKELSTEEFTALRAEAAAAYEDFQFVTQEVDTFVKEANATRKAQIDAQAKEAVKVLKEAIPGWNQTVYNELRTYAIEKGMPAEAINSLVDPNAIQMIHKAMQFDKAKKVVTTKKKVVTASKVLKTTKQVTSRDVKVEKNQKAMTKLKSSGSTDDAADLFLSRWADSE
jgi:hypothetical protein